MDTFARQRVYSRVAAERRYATTTAFQHASHEGLPVDWVFDGVGTLIIGLVVGGGAGSIAGYRIGIRTNRQTQKARDNANQNMTTGGSITSRDGK